MAFYETFKVDTFLWEHAPILLYWGLLHHCIEARLHAYHGCTTVHDVVYVVYHPNHLKHDGLFSLLQFTCRCRYMQSQT